MADVRRFEPGTVIDMDATQKFVEAKVTDAELDTVTVEHERTERRVLRVSPCEVGAWLMRLEAAGWSVVGSRLEPGEPGSVRTMIIGVEKVIGG